MPYKKANRHVTDEQFSENTTIDGTRIDKAIGDLVVHHNDIPKGDAEAQWMPCTFTTSWTPARPKWRWLPNTVNVQNRFGVNHSMASQNNWFPWLKSHNTVSEIYPASSVDTGEIRNEFRVKGYYHNIDVDKLQANRSRSGTPVALATDYNGNNDNNDVGNGKTYIAPIGTAGTLGDSPAPVHVQYFTCEFPFYFDKPVIIMGVSVFAAQEHPVSFFNSGLNAATGAKYIVTHPYCYKDPGAAAPLFFPGGVGYDRNDQYPADIGAAGTNIENNVETAFDPRVAAAPGNNYLPASTGQEMPGELYTFGQSNFGLGTIQISIDNSHRSEQRNLNNVIFHKTQLGQVEGRFNQFHTTCNDGAVPSGPARWSGDVFQDMQPPFLGGSTWGVWIRESDLNIPVPRDSRVRFNITNKGMRAGQIFDWHVALTFLELVED